MEQRVERKGYKAFLELPSDKERYQRMADIINNNTGMNDPTSWSKEDADVIIGLYDEKRNGFVTLHQYLYLDEVCVLLKKDSETLLLLDNVERVHKDLNCYVNNDYPFISELRNLHPDGADQNNAIPPRKTFGAFY